ncbi:outer membrane protein assembly factor BamA [Candidatus Methylopumilus universalis]|uniref:outer membrane protein assembly factor BamA n=1 Tax=Candidatus Methylopumilus universalis TaxID=2588536 RepID=UPI00111FBD47|nr:outer membrane protein assembly factor BamA [Candidatus Methylopumilus universalis]QDC80250.1 outer membrane protein assembly factor BamA [Candidatus Methylopumilus universalis]QDC81552.1 outer membrane protein assembly factor BamA [Candidatus Methylopumilus universalis]QDC87989.1 outer membrane protein assembly factor BamA [Candidatus Methylopumilus universalis]
MTLRSKLALFISLLLLSIAAFAMEPFVIKDIKIEGLQRTEPGTVFNYLPVQVGDTMTEDKSSEAIKSLYRTGFFKDVRIEADQNILLITVQERPSIADIQFSGNKAFQSDKLKEGMKGIGLTEGQIYDKSKLEFAEQEIKKQYLAQGKYTATVKTSASPLERNRVAIRFDIEEGIVSRIKEINVVGNQLYSQKDITSQFQLQTTNWLSWWYKDDQYSKQKLTADLETLKSFYMNRGYLEFSVDSTQVSITPDKDDVYITINISEGPKYKVSDVKLAGDLQQVPESELQSLIKIKKDDIFNREKVTESTKGMNARLGNDGFAFSNVNAIPEINKEEHTASFTFFVDPGRKVYVRRIDIEGNQRTRDDVIRREFRQVESGWYAADKIDRSKVRLNRTQFFSDVNIETPAVPGSTDQVDLKVKVTERNTGSIMFGAGLSSSEGIIGSFNVTQANFLGTGDRVAAQVNTGRVNKTYSLSVTKPFYTPEGISLSYDIYRRDVNTSSLNVVTYNTSSYGAGIRFTVPLSEKNAISYGLTLDSTEVSNLVVGTSPTRYIQYCSDVTGASNSTGCSMTSLVASLGWSKDSRDNILMPKNGEFSRVSGEISAPGLDIQMYKLTLQETWYKGLNKNFTVMLNGQFGYANSYGGKEFPFFKNFYVGGVNTVRGYRQGALGAYQTGTGSNDNIFLGGNKQIIANAELFMPVPFLKNNDQFRLSAFVDAGNVYGHDESINLSDLRYSAGMGLMWVSPFGPLKLVYAKPFNNQITDKTESIQFQMGQQF